MKHKLAVLGAVVCLLLMAGVFPVNHSSAEPRDNGFRQFDTEHITFENPSESTTLKKRSFSVLPAKYDMREQGYAGYVRVKNQKDTNLCWAFAATTAAEISVTHEQAASGAAITPVEFSPVHLAYFIYNRQNDRLGNTGNDTNTSPESYSDAGGNSLISFQAMAGWTGLASERKAPFSGIAPVSLSAKLAYDNDYILESAEFIGNDDMTASISEVKRAIYEHGAAAADIYMSDTYLNGQTSAYKSIYKSANHIVTIVGWDDDYKKENFKSTSIVRPPENDGAWIVQNSYGLDFGDNGYFYVSYEEPSLADPMVLTVVPASSYDYNYQYDGSVNIESINAESGEKVANVYTVPASSAVQYLSAVGFTTYETGSKIYDIAVYTDVKGTSSPVSGSKACSFSVTTDNQGFITFKLPQTVKLAAGTKYSIVVTMKSETAFGIETSQNYGWIRFRAGLNKYQSYYQPAGSKWYDLYNYSACARIKGFTTEEKPINMSGATATLSTLYYKCTGEQRRAVPVVKYNGKYLKNGVDYTLSYGTNKYPGYGYIYITGKGDFTGKITKKFYISRVTGLKVSTYSTESLRLSWTRQSNVSGYRIYRYVSGEYKYIGRVVGEESTSYTVRNLYPGKAYSFRVCAYKTEGGNTYYGVKSDYLSAPTKPSKVSLTKLTTGTSHYVRAYWKQKTCTGYQVKIARNASFTSYAKVYNISSYNTLSKKITGLTPGKYYYVKVRAYKTYGGKTVYGSWSCSGKIKCR